MMFFHSVHLAGTGLIWSRSGISDWILRANQVIANDEKLHLGQ
jgi:hypothetical protein